MDKSDQPDPTHLNAEELLIITNWLANSLPDDKIIKYSILNGICGIRYANPQDALNLIAWDKLEPPYVKRIRELCVEIKKQEKAEKAEKTEKAEKAEKAEKLKKSKHDYITGDELVDLTKWIKNTKGASYMISGICNIKFDESSSDGHIDNRIIQIIGSDNLEPLVIKRLRELVRDVISYL